MVFDLFFNWKNTDFWKKKKDKDFSLSVYVYEGLSVCLYCAPHTCSACGGQRRASTPGKEVEFVELKVLGEAMWV